MSELTQHQELIYKGRQIEREHIRSMIRNVVENPSLHIDSIPPRMVMQVLLASLSGDPEEVEELND